MMVELDSKEQWTELLESVDTVLFDCDGVLWSIDQAIPEAQDVIKYLRSKGKSVYFITNNSSKSRKEYLQKFVKLGFVAHEEEIFCTAYIAAYYLKNMLKYDGKVYLVGVSGFGHELDLVGLPYIGPGPDPVVGGPSDWLQMELDPEVGAVVVGFDNHFNLTKLTKACSYLSDPKCHFIATNEDSCLPNPTERIVIPGTGCFVTCVAFGAGRNPTIVGKPHKTIFEVIQHKTKLDPSKTVIFGDRLNTDIAFGNTHGMKSVLVFTGYAKREDIDSLPPESKPTFFTESVAGFLNCEL